MQTFYVTCGSIRKKALSKTPRQAAINVFKMFSFGGFQDLPEITSVSHTNFDEDEFHFQTSSLLEDSGQFENFNFAN